MSCYAPNTKEMTEFHHCGPTIWPYHPMEARRIKLLDDLTRTISYQGIVGRIQCPSWVEFAETRRQECLAAVNAYFDHCVELLKSCEPKENTIG